jgi:hypothetical protein
MKTKSTSLGARKAPASPAFVATHPLGGRRDGPELAVNGGSLSSAYLILISSPLRSLDSLGETN